MKKTKTAIHGVGVAGAALALLQAGAPAWAQTAPNIGNILQQAQPPVVPAPAAPALPPVGGAQPAPPAMTALPSGQPVAVRAIDIQGNRVVDTATLAALVADGAGRSLTLPELDTLAQRITRHYRDRGYFVARAYIPAQDVTSGTVRIQVVEGAYGQFRLKNASLVRDDIVQGLLDEARKSPAVSLDSLERPLLIINETPGVQIARADALPGGQVGTSDFAVETAATPVYNGHVMADNFGSRYTGRNRLSFNVDANSPTGRGDRLSLGGLATDTGDLVNGRLAYSALLAPNGLRGEVAVSQTQYQLGSTYRSLDAKGTARALDATLGYPLRRTRGQSLDASFNVNYKDLEDKVQSTGVRTPKQLASATLGLALRDESALFGLAGLTTANVGLGFGQLKINDDAARALDDAGPRAQGSFQKLTLGLSRLTLLPADFSLTASVRHQRSLTGKNLDSSEAMVVSGYAGVMAYPTGELLGSNATVARLELARPLPAWGRLQSSWQVFADWGQASAARPVAESDQRRDISDVGLGWTGSYGGLLVKAYLAHRLDERQPTSEPYSRDKLLLQAGWVF